MATARGFAVAVDRHGIMTGHRRVIPTGVDFDAPVMLAEAEVTGARMAFPGAGMDSRLRGNDGVESQ